MPLHKQHSGWRKREALSFHLQDENTPEELSRRRSSFTQLLGQASGLQDIFRRCSWNLCHLILNHMLPFSSHELSDGVAAMSRPYNTTAQGCAKTVGCLVQDFLQSGAERLQEVNRVPEGQSRQLGPQHTRHAGVRGACRLPAAAG